MTFIINKFYLRTLYTLLIKIWKNHKEYFANSKHHLKTFSKKVLLYEANSSKTSTLQFTFFEETKGIRVQNLIVIFRCKTGIGEVHANIYSSTVKLWTKSCHETKRNRNWRNWRKQHPRIMIEPTYPFQRQQQEEEKPEQTSRNMIQQGMYTHIKCNKFILYAGA